MSGLPIIVGGGSAGSSLSFSGLANLIAPSLSTVVPQIGDTVSVSDGIYTQPIVSYTYQWVYAKTGTNIVGATNESYIPVVADIGKSIKCIVTAIGSDESVSTSSDTIDFVRSGPSTITPAVGTLTYTPTVPVVSIVPPQGVTRVDLIDVIGGTTLVFDDKIVIEFIHNGFYSDIESGGTGNINTLWFPQSTPTLKLDRDYFLVNPGDRLYLERDAARSCWHFHSIVASTDATLPNKINSNYLNAPALNYIQLDSVNGDDDNIPGNPDNYPSFSSPAGSVSYGPLRTFDKLMEWLTKTEFDGRFGTPYIELKPGTYTWNVPSGGFQITPESLKQQLLFTSSDGVASTCILNIHSGLYFENLNLYFESMTMNIIMGPNDYHPITVYNGCSLVLSNCTFNLDEWAHGFLTCYTQGYVGLYGDTVVNFPDGFSNRSFIRLEGASGVEITGQVTINSPSEGTINWTQAFVTGDSGCVVTIYPDTTFVTAGTITGKKYNIQNGSVISLPSADINFTPGTLPGTVDSSSRLGASSAYLG